MPLFIVSQNFILLILIIFLFASSMLITYPILSNVIGMGPSQC